MASKLRNYDATNFSPFTVIKAKPYTEHRTVHVKNNYTCHSGRVRPAPVTVSATVHMELSQLARPVTAPIILSSAPDAVLVWGQSHATV